MKTTENVKNLLRESNYKHSEDFVAFYGMYLFSFHGYFLTTANALEHTQKVNDGILPSFDAIKKELETYLIIYK